MSRGGWVALLVVVGIGLAVLVGVLGTRNEPDKAEAASSLCSSLKTLESSITSLTSLDPSTASKSDAQNDVNAIQSDWNAVQSDAQDVQNASTGDLDIAWSSFESAVKSASSASSAQDYLNTVDQSAQQLESAAKATASSLSCS
jgi:hypothetical protein